MSPKDWLPPFPAEPQYEKQNAAHRAAWDEYARLHPGSSFKERTEHANVVIAKDGNRSEDGSHG